MTKEISFNDPGFVDLSSLIEEIDNDSSHLSYNLSVNPYESKNDFFEKFLQAKTCGYDYEKFTNKATIIKSSEENGLLGCYALLVGKITFNDLSTLPLKEKIKFLFFGFFINWQYHLEYSYLYASDELRMSYDCSVPKALHKMNKAWTALEDEKTTFCFEAIQKDFSGFREALGKLNKEYAPLEDPKKSYGFTQLVLKINSYFIPRDLLNFTEGRDLIMKYSIL